MGKAIDETKWKREKNKKNVLMEKRHHYSAFKGIFFSPATFTLSIFCQQGNAPKRDKIV